MANDAEAIVARARSLIDSRFRPQGRVPERGLDCVGVIMLAGSVDLARVPDNYRLRGGNVDAANAVLDALGFIRLPADQGKPGDVVVLRSGPAQLHGAVLTPAGYIHAHAGLRRVIETPGPLPWPVLSAWRYGDTER